MIGRVPEKLCENIFQTVAKSTGVNALVFDYMSELIVREAGHIMGPEFLDRLKTCQDVAEFYLFGEKRTTGQRNHAQPSEPGLPSHDQMSEPRDGLLELGRIAPVGRDALQRPHDLGVGVLLVREPLTETVGHGVSH